MTIPSELPTHEGLFLDDIMLFSTISAGRIASDRRSSRRPAFTDTGESSVQKYHLHFGIRKCCVRK
jgi:hypothetical protein